MNIQGKLIALQALANGSWLRGEMPKRLKLLNWGDNETTQGVVKVGFGTARKLAKNQETLGFDRIALDYEHNSLSGHPNYKPDPREVAAYGVPELIVGDGLYLKDIVYTPSGQEYAPNYSDLSPTPRLDETGEVDFLHSVALCAQGSVKGLTFLSAPTPTTGGHHDQQGAEEAVRQMLGFSKEAWDKATAGEVIAYSATAPLGAEHHGQQDAEEAVRQMLGISQEVWGNANPSEVVAYSASAAPVTASRVVQRLTDEGLRIRFKISREVWNAANPGEMSAYSVQGIGGTAADDLRKAKAEKLASLVQIEQLQVIKALGISFEMWAQLTQELESNIAHEVGLGGSTALGRAIYELGLEGDFLGALGISPAKWEQICQKDGVR